MTTEPSEPEQRVEDVTWEPFTLPKPDIAIGDPILIIRWHEDGTMSYELDDPGA